MSLAKKNWLSLTCSSCRKYSVKIRRSMRKTYRSSGRLINRSVSAAARELFGDVFVEHFVASRVWEAREHERNVDDWQLGRYFEII